MENKETMIILGKLDYIYTLIKTNNHDRAKNKIIELEQFIRESKKKCDLCGNIGHVIEKNGIFVCSNCLDKFNIYEGSCCSKV